MTHSAEQLRTRWSQLWLRLGVAAAKIPELDPLIESYESPDRAYHNLHHISQCLTELDALHDTCDKSDEVELAIWYHDVVYDARRHDNEERSAELAAKVMRDSGIASSFINGVTALILATKHSTSPPAGDLRIIVDIDLSILGSPQRAFDAYEQAIRTEYSFVDDASFRAGRSAILQKFLDRTAIYVTNEMRQKYEAAARTNLRRSIARLASQLA